MDKRHGAEALAAHTREVLTRFSFESSLEKWDALLENVVGGTTHAA